MLRMFGWRKGQIQSKRVLQNTVARHHCMFQDFLFLVFKKGSKKSEKLEKKLEEIGKNHV